MTSSSARWALCGPAENFARGPLACDSVQNLPGCGHLTFCPGYPVLHRCPNRGQQSWGEIAYEPDGQAALSARLRGGRAAARFTEDGGAVGEGGEAAVHAHPGRAQALPGA